MKKQTVISVAAAMLAWGQGAWAATLSGDIGTLTVVNDSGRFYTSAADANGKAISNADPSYRQFKYNFSLGGGGLNQLKINSTGASGVAQLLGGTATAGSYNGDFWIATNGGKGGNDDMILGVALTGPVSSDFALTIQSNGYVVAPNQTSRPSVTANNWQTDVVNETFYGSDFIYGPMANRPAAHQSGYQPLYNDQGSATGSLMFVDLGVADRTGSLSTQIVISVTGLYAGNVMAFSSYAYDFITGGNTAVDEIGWTTPTATTGYTVTGAGAAPAPVPVPPSIVFLASGLFGIGAIQKKSQSAKPKICRLV